MAFTMVVVTVTTTSNGNVLVEFNAFQHCTRYVISKVKVGPKIHNLPEILSFSLEKSEDFRLSAHLLVVSWFSPIKKFANY